MKLHEINPTAASGLEVGQAASLPAAPAGAKSVAKVTPAVGRLAACPTLAGTPRFLWSLPDPTPASHSSTPSGGEGRGEEAAVRSGSNAGEPPLSPTLSPRFVAGRGRPIPKAGAKYARILRTWGGRLLGLLASAGLAWAQGTAFSYQGQLTDGAAAANGTYDLTFSLWNAATAGDQQGATLTQSGVGVTNGLFTATLDFGGQFNGQNRWLEIAVRTNGAATFTTLAERQPVLPTPYAIHAETAGSAATATTATTVTGTIPATQLTGTLAAAQIPDLDASRITSGKFTGNGGGLTNLFVSALAQTNYTVSAWGWNFEGQTSIPFGSEGVISVAAGAYHSLALKYDGSVIAWGRNSSGQATVPFGLSRVTAISAGNVCSLALKADGTVVAWGDNSFGMATVPYGLSGVVAIAAGGQHNLALRVDGTVVGWGDNQADQTNVPVGLGGVVAIAAGYYHSLALKADGTVTAWGDNSDGQTTVPVDLSGVVAVAAGGQHSLALKSDGTVVAWGSNEQLEASVPVGLSGVVAIAAGLGRNLALKADGTVTAWGANAFGEGYVPEGLSKVVAVAAGQYHSLALTAESVSAATPAFLGRANVFQGPVSAVGFFGDGSGLTNLDSSALSSGTVPVARIPTLTPGHIPNLDASKITSGTFTGNGSGLTSLNASALTTGTVPVAQIPNLDAGKVTSGTFATARIPTLTPGHIPNLDASKITSGTFTGNGSGLTSLNASALTTGTVPVTQIPNLDAGKTTTGTLADARLSANVALLSGSPAFTSSVRLADTNLFLRGGSDTNHGLAWFGGGGRTFAGATVDGPVLYGFLGGALGSTKNSAKIALSWNDSADVILGGDLTITNSLSVTSPAGTRAARFAAARTGGHGSAVAHVENTETGTSASPALRVLGRGTATDGALSVSADAGRIARFGNATDWVAAMDNAGNFAATSFVTLSDRNKKAGFAPVDVDSVLAKVALLPLTTWHYTNDAAATPHLGPMAQDFHAAFGLGGNDKAIATVDADGVALAAIQGLHRKTEVLAAENAAIREELSAQRSANAELRDELGEVRALVLQLQQQLHANRP